VPRALRIATATIDAAERGGYLAALSARRERLRADGCNFWVYENRATPGSFTEFVEAHDQAIIAAAADVAPPGASLSPILTEVELS
jgi:hypothetical protein